MNFVDLNFIDKCISQLANYTEKDRPFTRLVFSKEFIQARAWLTQAFKELNLVTKLLSTIIDTSLLSERSIVFSLEKGSKYVAPIDFPSK